ncbi:FAD-dependent monooxygenase [Rhizorhapis suberifaciens]|uniref:2-polyprenyl-6-methoxyphenol hydroxylase-like FAD-dependent oxidoreductase n=1 Tax=Rhizorhapis suberifaciens TaxID=13656 RepID=A0A840HRA5_9SPHN|nr:FAD-dependent monooxygenase [Rhizorhapis suberifaciens]MBB4640169.1 2-polyprenyl-6-methoxyphenol hydroxylase-like FAD-dependent oxidoreductase [Rhizorhapis suberifaciens]
MMSGDHEGPIDVDVAIVGAGPVGLTIANYLGSMGVKTLILEQREKLIDYPRGVGMDDECLRSFQSIGLGDAVAAHTTPGQKMRFLTATGKTFALIAAPVQPLELMLARQVLCPTKRAIPQGTAICSVRSFFLPRN